MNMYPEKKKEGRKTADFLSGGKAKEIKSCPPYRTLETELHRRH